MGCLVALVLLALSAGIIFLGGVSKITLIIIGVLWIAGFVFTFIFGHIGFGTGSNTDMMMFIFVFGISLAIAVPYFHKYQEKMSCDQVRQALVEVSEVEKEYFSKHKVFTKEIKTLNLKGKQDVDVSILSADKKSFIAAASHKGCDMDNNQTPDLFTWDSAKGGLQ